MINTWSTATFGEDHQRFSPIVHHLKKEVQELLDTDGDEMEFADCMMLLLDAAKVKGICGSKVLALTEQKLEINKKRTWGKPDENGVVEHIPENLI